MKKYLFAILFIPKIFIAQQLKQDSALLEEVVVSGNKFFTLLKNSSAKIDLITTKKIEQTNAQSTADLLSRELGVFVQKSQQAGGSPILRGFEASRLLLVIDGIRFNNAIFRTGHLHNIISIDQNMLQRVEVIYGPASTLFGSDALGGAIHLISKKPELSNDKRMLFKSNVFTRLGTANKEQTYHLDFNLGWKKISWLGSFTNSQFSDLRMGSKFSKEFPNFGRRDSFIFTYANSDRVITNQNKLIQKYSAYNQLDIAQKLLLSLNKKSELLLNVQYSTTDTFPRYDRLQDISNNRLRFAEWNYGPQTRQLYALTYSTKLNRKWLDEFRINLNSQLWRESRITRENNNLLRAVRQEKINVHGLIIEGHKNDGVHNFTYGFDMQLNDLVSKSFQKDISTHDITAIDTRYPDGDNDMDLWSIYLQDEYKPKKYSKIVINEGLRYQRTKLNSYIKNNSFFNLPITQFKQNTESLTGNFGIKYFAPYNFELSTNISSAFRAPNIDDAVKVFESNSAQNRVIIPNENIKPEKTLSIDFGLGYKHDDNFNAQANIYHSFFRDALALAPTKLNGADSIVYNNIQSAVFNQQNIAKGNVYGIDIAINTKPIKNINLTARLNYTKGNFVYDKPTESFVYEKQSNSSIKLVKRLVTKKPMNHIAPLGYTISADYNFKFYNFNIQLLGNGAKSLLNYNADGEDNPQYATPIGTLAYSIINLQNRFVINKNFSLLIGVDNLLDKNYRPFASGLSGMGRNFYLSCRAKF